MKPFTSAGNLKQTLPAAAEFQLTNQTFNHYD
jgi:hypothetical protein